MPLSLRSRLSQPLKLGHALTALGAAFGVLWGGAKWMGMPNWGPGVANAQMVHKVDSLTELQAHRDSAQDLRQAKRDSSQDLVSMTIDARLDTMRTTTEATLRLVCTLTTPDKQYLAKVKC